MSKSQIARFLHSIKPWFHRTFKPNCPYCMTNPIMREVVEYYEIKE